MPVPVNPSPSLALPKVTASATLPVHDRAVKVIADLNRALKEMDAARIEALLAEVDRVNELLEKQGLSLALDGSKEAAALAADNVSTRERLGRKAQAAVTVLMELHRFGRAGADLHAQAVIAGDAKLLERAAPMLQSASDAALVAEAKRYDQALADTLAELERVKTEAREAKKVPDGIDVGSKLAKGRAAMTLAGVTDGKDGGTFTLDDQAAALEQLAKILSLTRSRLHGRMQLAGEGIDRALTTLGMAPRGTKTPIEIVTAVEDMAQFFPLPFVELKNGEAIIYAYDKDGKLDRKKPLVIGRGRSSLEMAQAVSRVEQYTAGLRIGSALAAEKLLSSRFGLKGDEALLAKLCGLKTIDGASRAFLMRLALGEAKGYGSPLEKALQQIMARRSYVTSEEVATLAKDGRSLAAVAADASSPSRETAWKILSTPELKKACTSVAGLADRLARLEANGFEKGVPLFKTDGTPFFVAELRPKAVSVMNALTTGTPHVAVRTVEALSRHERQMLLLEITAVYGKDTFEKVLQSTVEDEWAAAVVALFDPNAPLEPALVKEAKKRVHSLDDDVKEIFDEDRYTRKKNLIGSEIVIPQPMRERFSQDLQPFLAGGAYDRMTDLQREKKKRTLSAAEAKQLARLEEQIPRQVAKAQMTAYVAHAMADMAIDKRNARNHFVSNMVKNVSLSLLATAVTIASFGATAELATATWARTGIAIATGASAATEMAVVASLGEQLLGDGLDLKKLKSDTIDGAVIGLTSALTAGVNAGVVAQAANVGKIGRLAMTARLAMANLATVPVNHLLQASGAALDGKSFTDALSLKEMGIDMARTVITVGTMSVLNRALPLRGMANVLVYGGGGAALERVGLNWLRGRSLTDDVALSVGMGIATSFAVDQHVRALAVPPPRRALKVPPVQQPNDHTCAPSSALAILKYAGKAEGLTVEQVGAMMGTTENGTDNPGIVSTLNKLGVKAEANEALTFPDLVNNYKQGKLTMVCYEAYPEGPVPKLKNGRTDWANTEAGHYSVVVAADERGVWLMDPYMPAEKNGTLSRGFVPKKEFETRFYSGGKGSGIVVEVPTPTRVEANVTTARFID